MQPATSHPAAPPEQRTGRRCATGGTTGAAGKRAPGCAVCARSISRPSPGVLPSPSFGTRCVSASLRHGVLIARTARHSFVRHGPSLATSRTRAQRCASRRRPARLPASASVKLDAPTSAMRRHG
eukprot:scaffold3819_cov107-Isochrysis_galbana.AAC.4